MVLKQTLKETFFFKFKFIYFNWRLVTLQYESTTFKTIIQLLSHVRLFVTPWTAARQASLSFTVSQSLLKLMSIDLVRPSNHVILCHHLLLLPSVFPSLRVFSTELAFHIRWPKYWSYAKLYIIYSLLQFLKALHLIFYFYDFLLFLLTPLPSGDWSKCPVSSLFKINFGKMLDPMNVTLLLEVCY